MPLTRPSLNQINTTITALNDPLTVLNKDGTTANQDVGLVFNRDGGSSANIAVIWDETNDQFTVAFTSDTGATNANISITGYPEIVTGNLIPGGNLTYYLGSVDNQWHSLYVGPGSLYVNGQKVLQEDSGTIVFSADENQNISIQTAGSGDIEFNPGGSIELKGNVVLAAGKTLSQAGGAASEFSAGVKADSVTARTTNTSLTLSGNGTGVVNVNDSLTVANDVTVTGNLTVNGATTTVSSTNTNIEDALLLLADGQSGSPTKDAGFVVERGSSTNVAWLWDESADEFVAITTSDDATTVGDVSVTNYANVHASYFLGDGSQLTGLPETYGNTEVLAYLTDNSYATQTYVNTANTNMGGYVDNAVSTANVNLKGYVDNELTSYATSSDLTTANTNVVGYVDGEITTVNSTITTANTNVVGYVDDAVTTANVNLKGYTDATFETQSSATTANTNMKGYVDNELTSYATSSDLTTANTNVVGYVDGEVTTLNSAITTANTNLKGYSDTTFQTTSSATTANTNVVGYVDGEITTVNSTITTANTNVVGYVDNAVSTANVNLKGYVDAGNTNVVGYVDNAVTTANTNVIGYVDSAVTTANTNLKGYTDGQLASYATTSSLTTANTNMGGYVDNAVSTANVNLKGYADATFAQQTLTADLDGADTYGIINLVDPTSAQDAVTLSYLESALSSEVTNIISDDTSVTVTDDGVNPGYIELAVDGTTRANITSAGLTVTGNVESSSGYLLGDGSQITNLPDAGNAFVTISVSGQSDLVADSSSDTLTFVAGDGVVITTNAGTDTLTIATSGSGTSGFLNDSDFGDFTLASSSEDLGLVTESADTSIDLGELVTSGLLYPSQLILPSYATASLPNAAVAAQLAYDTDTGTVKYTSGSTWTAFGGISNVVEDSTPQLGGDLDLNSSDITGTGGINITGGVTATGTVTGGTLTDGTATISAGAISGVTTITASDDVTISDTSAVIAQTEGDYSAKRYVLHGVTTDATETEIFVGGVTNTRIPIATDTTITADAMFTARRTDTTGHSAGFKVSAVADNFSGTTADVGSVYEIIIADDSGNLAVDLQADDTNDALKVLVQGEAGKTIRWICVVNTVEVSQ